MTDKYRRLKANRDKKIDKREMRQQKGEENIKFEATIDNEDFQLGDFHFTQSQQHMAESFYENDLTAVQGSSGTGKTTTAVYLALLALRRGYTRRIVFVKTPTESSDDEIGFLQGGLNDKLIQHFEAMRGVFYSFMSIKKLELEEKKGRIKFAIPNFMQGATLDDTVFVIDEAQQISPKRLKLLLERIGKNSKILLLGDKYQDYAYRKRPDGFSHFVNMITNSDDKGNKVSMINNMGFVVLPANENMRSDLSRQIVGLYEKTFDESSYK